MVIIMCGGRYDTFEKHKALSVINGEPLVERTIRLLKENEITDIYISASEKEFEKYGNDDTYLSINDETIDIDAPWQIERLNERIRSN